MAQMAEPSSDEQFAAAFREWDRTFDVDTTSIAEAAARLMGRPAAVRAEVIAALDEWASERRRQGMPPKKWRRVSELASALDDEPGSKRHELRRLLGEESLERERGLAVLALVLRPVPIPFDGWLGRKRQDLRRLVKGTDVAIEPVLGLLSLARALRQSGDDQLAEQLLVLAVQARPQEVTLQHALGQLRVDQKRWRDAVECFAAARALRRELGVNLAEALVYGKRVNEGLALFARLTIQRPDNPWLHLRYSTLLRNQGRNKEAEAHCRETIRLSPDDHAAHTVLGLVVLGQGRIQEAEAALHKAIRLKHDSPAAHSLLGLALFSMGRQKEAERACREAIRLMPDGAIAHTALGLSLREQGRYAEAEEASREAIRLRPDHTSTHWCLGTVLAKQSRHREAEAVFRTAIRLSPGHHMSIHGLGNALESQRRYEEAEAVYREAIRLKFDDEIIHYSLARILDGRGRLKEAESALREAIRIKSDYPAAHYSLGNSLRGQDRYKEAEAALREAIRLDPDMAEAHCNLGHVLADQGRYVEALEVFRRGHALGTARPDWTFPSADWVRRCRRIIELDRLLPAVLNGDRAPASPRELIELASLCRYLYKRCHATSARLAADAFAADPKLADDHQEYYRYNAACSAALAAAGQAEDARLLPDRVVAKLRRQAFHWLQAEMEHYSSMAKRNNPATKQTVHQALIHWRQDTDLVSVRDGPALGRLDADERQQWQRLWQDVDVLIRKTNPKK
jgi:tetratricopeptide (TPR) repeat protein